VADPHGGSDIAWGLWAWIALGITIVINVAFYAVLVVFDLFHGSLMGKLAAAFNILSAGLVFWVCHWMRPKKGA
jgi:hypothetical protein